MVFGIAVNSFGVPECKCCRLMLIHKKQIWHCKNCWDRHHNGLKHNDWEERPPEDESHTYYIVKGNHV